jgi:hypothetical protein
MNKDLVSAILMNGVKNITPKRLQTFCDIIAQNVEGNVREIILTSLLTDRIQPICINSWHAVPYAKHWTPDVYTATADAGLAQNEQIYVQVIDNSYRSYSQLNFNPLGEGFKCEALYIDEKGPIISTLNCNILELTVLELTEVEDFDFISGILSMKAELENI